MLLIAFPLGQLTRITIFSPEIHIHILDILAGLTIPISAILFFKKQLELEKKPFIKPFLLFLFFLHLSLAINLFHLSGKEFFVAYLYLFRIMAYASVFITSYWFVRSSNSGKLITSGLIYSALATALMGLVQYLVFPDIRPLEVYGWDPHLFRLVGTFLDPGFIGLVFNLAMIAMICQNWQKLARFTRPHIIFHFSFFIFYLSMMLTYSRASYLAFLAGITGISLWKKSWKILIFSLLLFTLTLTILPRPESIGTRLEREDSIRARIQNWKNTITIFADHPIFGVGFNAYRASQIKYGFLSNTSFAPTNSTGGVSGRLALQGTASASTPDSAHPEPVDGEHWREGQLATGPVFNNAGNGADSSLLFTFATSGVLGGGSLLWFLYSLIRYSLQKSMVIVHLSLFTILIHSLFLNSLYYPWVMLWISLTLAYNLASSNNAGGARGRLALQGTASASTPDSAQSGKSREHWREGQLATGPALNLSRD